MGGCSDSECLGLEKKTTKHKQLFVREKPLFFVFSTRKLYSQVCPSSFQNEEPLKTLEIFGLPANLTPSFPNNSDGHVLMNIGSQKNKTLCQFSFLVGFLVLSQQPHVS